MRSRLLAAAAIVLGVYGHTPAFGQVAGERVLSRASVSESARCITMDIRFNYPLRIISNFPIEFGNQVLIRLRPADGVVQALTKREALPAPQTTANTIRDIEYDGSDASGPTLTIYFAQPIFFRLAQSPDFQTLTVTIASTQPDLSCMTAPRFMTEPRLRPSMLPPPAAAEPEILPDAPGGSLLDEARIAVTNMDYEAAIRLLTKALSLPEDQTTPDAQELLAIVRERNGQLAHAKAEYEEYLRRYPQGEGADRVRQRLAALLRNALSPQTPPLPGLPAKGATKEAAELGTRWRMRGSISEYYYHDQMKTVVNDDVNHIVIDNGYTTLQSQLVSAVDSEIGFETTGFQALLRIAAAQTKDFLASKNDDTRVAQLYLEGSNSDRSLLARVGRQYRTSGGMLGRFDGALLSYQPVQHFRTELIAGFPVDSSRSSFKTDRQAYGASLAYLNGPWNADIYAMQQTDNGLLDRRPIGVEARYVSGQSSLMGILEYDLHFSDINMVLLNGTTTFGKTIFNVALDSRRSPLLRTSNAIIGQPAGSLADLLSTYTESEIHQLAIDRTAKSKSAFISVTQPFDDRFSAGLDVTLWHLSGMPASGNIPAMPSTGTEYYYSAHFIATDLLMSGDMEAVTIGYARSYNGNRYTFDFNTRFPMMRDLRIGPRFFASYRQATGLGSTSRYTGRPTIRLNYRVRTNFEVEFEGGAEWEKDVFGTTTIQTWDFIGNLGLRLDF